MKQAFFIMWHYITAYVSFSTAESFLRCRRNDPDLDSCLQAAIQKAILIMKDGWYERFVHTNSA